MEHETQKLQKDIISLRDYSRRIQNSNDIPKYLKKIQLHLISKLIARTREKINYLMDRQKCNLAFWAKKWFANFVKREIIELLTVLIRKRG